VITWENHEAFLIGGVKERRRITGFERILQISADG
jgi:hypothetical protein